MFKEIKRQITLFNTLILIVFLFLFILLLGFMVQWSLGISGEMYLVETAKGIINKDANAGKTESLFSNGAVHDQFGYEYIEWDANNNVVSKKIEDNALIMKGYELAMDKNANGEFHVFNLDGNDFRVYITRFQQDDEDLVLQVYQQISTERSVITYIISFLLFIGTGGILMLIPISYFLAGKSLQPIKQTFENQKKFIADASHELRTPITVIQTNVEVLKLKEDDILKDNLKWLNNISLESETMAKLVSELLMIAQADNQKVSLEKSVFDLSALCAEIIDLMYDLAKEKGILIKGAISEGVEYYGDEERIKQAIRIFVDNAIKYTHGEGTITLGLTENKRSYSISIKDTGIGLSEEAQKKIFGRFYRVDDARNRETGGVGLGLNIADVIVRQHNGRIKVESELDVGSTFTIILPKTSLK